MFLTDDVTVCQTYSSYLKLWNAGCVSGIAHLHFTNVDAPFDIPDETTVTIWYDTDGDEDLEEIDSGTMADLECTYWELGLLPSGEVRRLQIDLQPEWEEGTFLGFDTVFGLVQDLDGCFSDTEQSYSYLTHDCAEGTIGFWKNWDKHNTYTQTEIEDWLDLIDGSSDWLGPIDVDGMEAMLTQASGGTMEEKFLGHYLAQRLNLESGRQGWATTHDITGISGYSYLIPGPAPDPVPDAATATEIITAIESKYGDSPNYGEFETMKDVCDKLNSLEI